MDEWTQYSRSPIDGTTPTFTDDIESVGVSVLAGLNPEQQVLYALQVDNAYNAVYATIIEQYIEKIRKIIAEELDKRFVRVTSGSEQSMPKYTEAEYRELHALYLIVHEEYQRLQKEYVALKAELEDVDEQEETATT